MSRRTTRPEESEGRGARHFSLLRTFVPADLITLANAACGTAAVLCCVRYVGSGERLAMWAALLLVPLAAVCDVADGRIARWRHRHSPFGAGG